jgi:polysaccharide biosynthesis transport protein
VTEPMNRYELTPRDYIAILARRRSAFFSGFAGVLSVAVLISALLPSMYRGSATILIEQQEIPPELVRSTITSYADQRIQTINQRVMTGENLLGIIEKFDLYPHQRRRIAREELLERVRANISLKIVSAEVMDPRRGVPTNATIAFTLGFEDGSPNNAYRVTNELTSLYLNKNLQTRSDLAKDATVFLNDEAQRLQREVADLETNLAAFKERHGNALPELFEVNLQLFDRAERDLEEVERSLRSNEDRKVYLESELALQNPYQSMFSDTGERLLSPADRIKSLQSELASLVGIYSEDHPDVKRIRDELAGLRAEVGEVERRRELAQRLDAKRAELAAISDRYSEDHPAVKVLRAQLDALLALMDESVVDERITAAPTNPAYVQLKAQLDTVKLEREGLLQRKRSLGAKLEDVESRLQRAPQIEREYRELSSNLQNANSKYLEVSNKTMEARLGESLEVDRKGERFTLIDPAQMPEKPVSPNRVLILSLGLVLAIVAGFVTVAAYEALDQRVFGAQMVTALLGAAPLGVIPLITTETERLHAAKVRRRAAGGAVLAMVLAAFAAHVLIMPLDTAMFALLRRYGL